MVNRPTSDIRLGRRILEAKSRPRGSRRLSYRGGYVALQMNAEEAIHRTRELIRRQHKALATEASYVS